jgi:ribosomal protein S18 acetylase RimI-like enzyme
MHWMGRMLGRPSDPPLEYSSKRPMSASGFQVVSAVSGDHLDAVRELIREYVASLDIDLSFQRIDDELATLPAEYQAPGGALLLALVDGQPAGCGAMRPLADVDYVNACEMKRLYVRRAFRRFGLGRVLAQQLMDQATQAGHSTMLLDTLHDMEAARGLYVSLGFQDIPPYYFNPLPGAHYLKVELDAPGTRW